MGTRRQNGYTILEVMIFLMITGFLFASAVIAVGGSQDEARYSQTVRDFETQIKDVANDVSSGYYPAIDRGVCTHNASGVVSFSTTSSGPAENEECINIGKNLMFNVNRESQFGVGTIVGANASIVNPVDLSLTALNPTLAFVSGELDLTEYKPIRFGAEVTKIGSDSNPSQTYSSLSFISDFSTTVSASNTRSNGTLSTNVYGYKGALTASSTQDEYKNDILDLNNTTTPLPYDVNPSEGFYVCLLTTDNRRARVIIGVDGVVTATKTEFDLDAGGVCP